MARAASMSSTRNLSAFSIRKQPLQSVPSASKRLQREYLRYSSQSTVIFRDKYATSCRVFSLFTEPIKLALCGGHIARLRGPGNDLHVVWTHSPKRTTRIGWDDTLPEVAHALQFTDSNENIVSRQQRDKSLFPEPAALVNLSVQTRSSSSTSILFNMAGELRILYTYWS